MTGHIEHSVPFVAGPFVAGTMRALLGIVLWTSPLGAHGLEVKCELTSPDRIQIEVSYEDGGFADLATVRLRELAAGGTEPAAVMTEGKADEKGVFSCARPASREFRLEVEHAGHLGSMRVRIDEGGAVSLEPLEQEPHDHDQKKIILFILFTLLIVIGARLVVRLIRGDPSRSDDGKPDASAAGPEASGGAGSKEE